LLCLIYFDSLGQTVKSYRNFSPEIKGAAVIISNLAALK